LLIVPSDCRNDITLFRCCRMQREELFDSTPIFVMMTLNREE
jgi:hypothetical protein